MTRLSWSAPAERFFETGLDRGVFYPKVGAGVPWNGLTGVDENGSDSVTVYYIDGRPFLNFPRQKEYTATLTAYTYPDEFSAVMGFEEVDDLDGIYLDSQVGESFSLSYRTLVGNAVESTDLGYKIHLVYNATVAPQGSSYESLADSVNPSAFAFDISAVPSRIPGYAATAHVVIDTRRISEENLEKIETLLYGDSTTDPSLPDPYDLFEFLKFGDSITIVDHGDDTWSAEGAAFNIHSINDDIFQIDNVNVVDNGNETFNITSVPPNVNMGSIQTVSQERAAEIEAAAVISAEIQSKSLILTTDGGTVINAGRIGPVELYETPLPSPPVIVTVPATIDSPAYDVVVPEWYQPGEGTTKLADVVTPPNNGIQGMAWSPDGVYLALAITNNTPYFTVYKRAGDVMTKLATPTQPTGLTSAKSVAWSPDGQYVVVGHNGTPFITMYKRAGDTFTKLADTTAALNTPVVTWSPDGIYLAAVSTITSPYLALYKRSGDTLTRLADPAVMPPDTCGGAAWSPDGLHLVVGHRTSPYMTIYKQNGDVFTKLTDPATMPPAECRAVSWHYSGQYVVLATTGSPFVVIYKRAGDVFTKLTTPTVALSGATNYVSFSPDGKYVANSGAGIALSGFKFLNEVLTKVRDMVSIQPTAANVAIFSPDGRYLAATLNVTPWLVVYKTPGILAAGTPVDI